MKIAIIGGGFTGLAAAYDLTRAGHEVTVFERDSILGGLALGWKELGWEWSLEKAYHHWFTNDEAVLALIKEVGLADKLLSLRPITGNYWHGKAYQFDSPLHFMKFPGFTPLDKLRTGALVAGMKLNPFWRPLEGITAQNFFEEIGGRHAWNVLWGPLLYGKFGDLAPTVAASWLWARIKKRTSSLCYMEGGFQTLVDRLATAIQNQGGTIKLNTEVPKIEVRKKENHWSLDIGHLTFDKILLTIPTPLAVKLIPELAGDLKESLTIPHLHAQTLILETKEPILKDVYWLNILDRSFPFLAAVQHTNFVDKSHYAGHHLCYFGNYLPSGHPYLTLSDNELLKIFRPYIQKINPDFNLKFKISNLKLFTAPFAQPVHQLHYSKRAPKLKTPIPNLYVANMDSIYPWDRGTNYAVELGRKAADKILSSE